MSSELAGQVALITGGGRGIGRSIALELTEAGAKVAVSSRTRSEVEATAEEIGGLAIEADVSRLEDVERMVIQTEAQLGPIDLLVANAGVMISEPDGGWAVEPEAWWHVFEINVFGVYLANRTVIPGMIDRGRGRIVNVASGAAYLPGTPGSAYGASKAAVHRMSEALAGPAEAARDPGVLDQPGPRAHGDDRGHLQRRCALDARPNARRGWCAGSRRAGSTRSPAATSTPSTTTSTTSSAARTRSSRTT